MRFKLQAIGQLNSVLLRVAALKNMGIPRSNLNPASSQQAIKSSTNLEITAMKKPEMLNLATIVLPQNQYCYGPPFRRQWR